MKLVKLLGLSLLLTWVFNGAASAQTPQTAEQAVQAAAAAAAVSAVDGIADGNYIIRPSDVLDFGITYEPDMQQQIRVAQDGSISLPLIGRVVVGNMTVEDAQKLITEQYDRDYLVNPQVRLVVLSYKERRVFVHGQVNIPGPVIIPPEVELTLAQAISAAGGLNRIARYNPILIKRIGRDETIEVNFNDVLKDPHTKDIPLQHGDIITVQERWI